MSPVSPTTPAGTADPAGEVIGTAGEGIETAGEVIETAGATGSAGTAGVAPQVGLPGAAGAPSPPRPAGASRLVHALVLAPRRRVWRHVHLATLGVAAVVLLVANRHQWFYGDEWAFIADRGPGLADLDLLRPHNDHWSTIPLLVYWALLGTVGLSSYLPYAAVVVGLHLALAHLLWRACLRAGARPAIATGCVGIFAVLGAGAENLLWAFQMGFVGAVACGWAAVLLHDHGGTFGGRRDVAGWAASIAALMFSGPGVVMVGVAAATVWFRRGRMAGAVLTAAPPALVYAAWWLAVGRHAERVATHPGDQWRLVDWAWRGLTHAAESVVGVPQTGGLLALALLLWWARHLDLARSRAALALAGTLGAGAFYLFTGVSRVSLGPDAATAGRYVYIAAALLLPVAALAVTRTVPAGPGPTAFVLAACAVVAVHNLGLLHTRATEEMTREQLLRGMAVATAGSLRQGDRLPQAARLPSPAENPNVTAGDLRRLDKAGWLPGGSTTPAQELTAEALTRVTLQRTGTASQLDAVGITGRGVTLVPSSSLDDAPCLEVQPTGGTPQVWLSHEAASWRVRVEGRPGATLAVQLRQGEVAGGPVSFALPSGPRDLVSRAGARTVAVTLPTAAPTTFCGVVRTEG